MKRSSKLRARASFTWFLSVGLVALLVASSGCGPSRAVIPPGEIPPAPQVSAEDEQYGHNVLSELTRQYPLERSDAAINSVRDIVERLARAANAANEPWHVFVLRGDSVVNAAATRGNYVMVWTGLLRLARTEGELATVLAHELGHLLAGHTQPTAAEEASAIIAQTTGDIAGQVLATQGSYGVLASIAGSLVTEAIKAVAVNPESQRQELEADQIGFFLMADAGYDPNEALAIWSTLSADNGGSALQFLSSHPANEERLEALRALLPRAVRRYEDAIRKTPPSNRTRNVPPTQAQDDSFSFGRDSVTPTTSPASAVPPVSSPSYRREPVRRRVPAAALGWVVVEPDTAVRQAPFGESTITGTLPNGTAVDIKGRVGSFYEISLPSQGFIPTYAVSPVR
jgi:Zn-dependent protease with chaperone function